MSNLLRKKDKINGILSELIELSYYCVKDKFHYIHSIVYTHDINSWLSTPLYLSGVFVLIFDILIVGHNNVALDIWHLQSYGYNCLLHLQFWMEFFSETVLFSFFCMSSFMWLEMLETLLSAKYEVRRWEWMKMNCLLLYSLVIDLTFSFVENWIWDLKGNKERKVKHVYILSLNTLKIAYWQYLYCIRDWIHTQNFQPSTNM